MAGRILADLTQVEAKQITTTTSAQAATPVVKPRMAFKAKSIQAWRKGGERSPLGTRRVTASVAASTHARTNLGFSERPSVFGKRTNVRTSSPHVTTVR